MVSTTETAKSIGSLRRRLLSNHDFKSYGPMIMSDSPVVAELLALVGYDHVIIDHEHSPTNPQSGQFLLQAIDSATTATILSDHKEIHRTEPIVRLPSPYDSVYMKKVLDSMRLPAGVLVPFVNDGETARQVVQSIRYPNQDNLKHSPNGSVGVGGFRGCAIPFIRSNYYGLRSDIKEYMNQCQQDLLVLVQIETKEAVKNITEIGSVDGIDGIFLGPFDLSTSLGYVGQNNNNDQVIELISTAEELVRTTTDCLLTGFYSSLVLPNRTLYDMFHQHQYRLVCGSVDIGLLRTAAIQDLINAENAKAKIK